MDGDINERLIKNNNINDDGTGGGRDAVPFFGGNPNSQSDLVRLCIFLGYILQIDRQLWFHFCLDRIIFVEL